MQVAASIPSTFILWYVTIQDLKIFNQVHILLYIKWFYLQNQGIRLS